MDAKKILTNQYFCPMPWTGLMYNFDGQVKNCIRSLGPIGDLRKQDIKDILHDQTNLTTQEKMLSERPGQNCHTCYDLERGKKNFDIISDRIFYIKELKKVPLDTYRPNNHDLQVIDVRWTNLCNFACVYCSPVFSSKWAAELEIKKDTPSDEQLLRFKEYIFERAPHLKHVYLAGGEPLLMKENLELLELLKEKNPEVNLRINTNLSKVDTRVFNMICEFKNVHWTISVETLGEEFEYIRYGSVWQDFLDNLYTVQKLTGHKISFNMLYFLLNYRSFFDCIDFLQNLGFHPNSFIAGALLSPLQLNIRHLPDQILSEIKTELDRRIDQRPGYLLEDSLKNLRHYIAQPFEKDLDGSFAWLHMLDRRRNIDSCRVFPDLYNLDRK